MKLLIKLLIAGGSLTPAFWLTISSPVNATIADDRGSAVVNAVVGAITPSFTMSRTTGVAPLGVHFDASATTATTLTSLPFHELHYAWSFGDPAGGATWAYGTNPGVASKNTAYGPTAAHVFETAGTYTVTLWVYHIDAAGTITSASVAGSSSITVTDPNTVFAGSATLCISSTALPVAGVGGVPAGATCELLTTWSTVATRAQTYKRILLKRGDTWTPTSTASFGASQVGEGILGAYGTGNKPKVTMDADNNNAINFTAGADDWRLVDLEITSISATYQNNQDNINVVASNILLLRCALSGGRILVGGSAGNGLYVVDSVIGPSSTLGYSIGGYIDKKDKIAYLGCRTYSSLDHGLRLQGTSTTVVSNCTFEATRGSNTHTFTMRGKANDADVAVWNGLWSENNVISDNKFDCNGGSSSAACVKIGPQANGHAERLRNIICERNTIAANAVLALSTSVAENLTFRNNITVSYGQNAISLGSDPGLFSPAPSSGYFYNNTFYKPDISLSNGYSVAELSGTPTGQVFKNNLAYAPADTRDGATNGSSPAFYNIAGGLTDPTNYTGSNNSSSVQIKSTRPWSLAAPVNAVDFTPSGTYAVNGGAYVPIRTDFFNADITGTREIGAIQS